MADVEEMKCSNCGHPKHVSVNGTQSCGICLNQYANGKRSIEDCCTTYRVCCGWCNAELYGKQVYTVPAAVPDRRVVVCEKCASKKED